MAREWNGDGLAYKNCLNLSSESSIKETYSTVKDKVEEACLNIEGNSCQKLKAEIMTTEGLIRNLNLYDWAGVVAEDFQTIIEASAGSLHTIVNSINNVFSPSEKVYQILKTYLEALETNDSKYQTYSRHKPNKDDYTSTIDIRNVKGDLIGTREVVDPEYDEQLKKWKKGMQEFCTSIGGQLDIVDEGLNRLNNYNNATISIDKVSGSNAIAVETMFKNVENIEAIKVPQGYDYGTKYTYMGWQRDTGAGTSQLALRIASGQHFDERGFGVIDDRYVIAMTNTFGKVGDYVDVYLGNGDVIHAIIGDIKSQGDKGCNKWGHQNGKVMVEFVVDCNKWYKSDWKHGSKPNPGQGIYDEEFANNGGVLQVVNLGTNYFLENDIDRTSYDHSDITAEYVRRY